MKQCLQVFTLRASQCTVLMDVNGAFAQCHSIINPVILCKKFIIDKCMMLRHLPSLKVLFVFL